MTICKSSNIDSLYQFYKIIKCIVFTFRVKHHNKCWVPWGICLVPYFTKGISFRCGISFRWISLRDGHHNNNLLKNSGFSSPGIFFLLHVVVLVSTFNMFILFRNADNANPTKKNVIVFDISRSVSPFNSFMTEVPVIKKPVYRFALQINGLVSIW